MLPVPPYFATCGYGHSGRVRSTRPAVLCDARIDAGACPRSTHDSSAPIESNEFGPTPPPQCCIPGTMNNRIQSVFEEGACVAWRVRV